jgi:hypothetical protein
MVIIMEYGIPETPIVNTPKQMRENVKQIIRIVSLFAYVPVPPSSLKNGGIFLIIEITIR